MLAKRRLKPSDGTLPLQKSLINCGSLADEIQVGRPLWRKGGSNRMIRGNVLWTCKATGAVSLAAFLIASSAFGASVGVGVGGVGVGATAGSSGVGVGASAAGVGVGASAGASGVGASASTGGVGVGASAGANGVGASASAGGVGVGASASANGVGASAGVGSSAAGVGVGVGAAASSAGVGVSATSAASPSSAGVAAGSVAESPALGISAVEVQGRLNGREGYLWRALLKKRCPAIIVHAAQYDPDLVDLCRFVATRAIQRNAKGARVASSTVAIARRNFGSN
jgi:hypothetical protein